MIVSSSKLVPFMYTESGALDNVRIVLPVNGNQNVFIAYGNKAALHDMTSMKVLGDPVELPTFGRTALELEDGIVVGCNNKKLLFLSKENLAILGSQ